MKERWQKDTVIIIAYYKQEFIDFLKKHGKRPGLMKVRAEGKKYNIQPGVKHEVPKIVATTLEKQTYVDRVLEVG